MQSRCEWFTFVPILKRRAGLTPVIFFDILRCPLPDPPRHPRGRTASACFMAWRGRFSMAEPALAPFAFCHAKLSSAALVSAETPVSLLTDGGGRRLGPVSALQATFKVE